MLIYTARNEMRKNYYLYCIVFIYFWRVPKKDEDYLYSVFLFKFK